MMMNARNRFPFTPSQWEELEHQALIFKYMMSGVPVPPDLILTVKRSCEYSSSMSSALPSYRPNFGWGCFQMGFGRKVDTEPWRCRRTDGKKWRCSKEAFPDSKYCERHMHRGRNRSRKPVEQLITTNNPSLSPSIPSTNNIINNSNSTSSIISPTTSSHSFSTLLSSSRSTSETPIPHHHHPFHNHPFLSPPPASSSRPPAASCMSPQNNTTHHLFFDSASYSKPDGNYRYVQGMRGGLDDRKIFPEASGTLQSLPDSYAPLTKNSSDGYSQLLFQSHTDNSKQEKQQQQQQQDAEENNCFILGSDFKSTRPIKVEREGETRKPFHHFLGEWPQNSSRDSWLEIDQKNQSNNNASFFSKNLSVSMPLSTQNLFATKDRYHIDG